MGLMVPAVPAGPAGAWGRVPQSPAAGSLGNPQQGSTLDALFEHMYDSGMTTAPPDTEHRSGSSTPPGAAEGSGTGASWPWAGHTVEPGEDTTTYYDIVTGEPVTVGLDVNNEFFAIVAQQSWFHCLLEHPPEDRVPMLMAAPIGMELLAELRCIDVRLLDDEKRLLYAHLWERCVGWVTDQAAQATAVFIDAVTDPPEERPYRRRGVSVAPGVCLREVAIATGLSDSKAAMRVLCGAALAKDGPLAETGRALRAGRISYEVAATFVDATLGLTDAQIRAVEDRVLPRAVTMPVRGATCP